MGHNWDTLSSLIYLLPGVQQESVLGLILFSIYLLSLGNIICHHETSYHIYADDAEL